MAHAWFHTADTSLGGDAATQQTVLPGLQQSRRLAKDAAKLRIYEGDYPLMSLGQELAPHLPFLRRYARALTGSQAHGDAFARATSILGSGFTRLSTRSGRPPMSRKGKSLPRARSERRGSPKRGCRASRRFRARRCF